MKKRSTPAKDRMKSILISLLVIAAASCYYGAINLIENGGGSNIGLSHDFLDTTVVEYLFPGVLTFYAIGLFTIIVFIVFLGRKRIYRWLLISEGALLLLWSAIQLILLGFPLIPLHFLLIFLGILFTLSGIFNTAKIYQ
ncbi:hypothetical protein WG904_12750 [Pedobacter sp. Du54]|uniref:hypothetical protein n=1 Tax=Pedobacter anseongensis TaxID=3133439 RepID=UPI0030A29E28